MRTYQFYPNTNFRNRHITGGDHSTIETADQPVAIISALDIEDCWVRLNAESYNDPYPWFGSTRLGIQLLIPSVKVSDVLVDITNPLKRKAYVVDGVGFSEYSGTNRY